MMSTAATASEIDEFLNGALISWVCIRNTLATEFSFFLLSFILNHFTHRIKDNNNSNIKYQFPVGQAKPN